MRRRGLLLDFFYANSISANHRGDFECCRSRIGRLSQDFPMKRSALRALKDNALEKAVLMFARPKFERYGELLSIKIDTGEKILRAELWVKGEPEPVTTSRPRYRVESKDNHTRPVR